MSSEYRSGFRTRAYDAVPPRKAIFPCNGSLLKRSQRRAADNQVLLYLPEIRPRRIVQSIPAGKRWESMVNLHGHVDDELPLWTLLLRITQCRNYRFGPRIKILEGFRLLVKARSTFSLADMPNCSNKIAEASDRGDSRRRSHFGECAGIGFLPQVMDSLRGAVDPTCPME